MGGVVAVAGSCSCKTSASSGATVQFDDEQPMLCYIGRPLTVSFKLCSTLRNLSRRPGTHTPPSRRDGQDNGLVVDAVVVRKEHVISDNPMSCFSYRSIANWSIGMSPQMKCPSTPLHEVVGRPRGPLVEVGPHQHQRMLVQMLAAQRLSRNHIPQCKSSAVSAPHVHKPKGCSSNGLLNTSFTTLSKCEIRSCALRRSPTH